MAVVVTKLDTCGFAQARPRTRTRPARARAPRRRSTPPQPRPALPQARTPPPPHKQPPTPSPPAPRSPQERFEAVKAALLPFLRGCGWEAALQWLPACAPAGLNLAAPPEGEPRLAAWWRGGRTLVGAVDALSPARATRVRGGGGGAGAAGASLAACARAPRRHPLLPPAPAAAEGVPRTRLCAQPCRCGCRCTMSRAPRRARSAAAASWRRGPCAWAGACCCCRAARWAL